MAADSKSTVTVAGEVETVTYHNAENGFFVARLRPDGSDKTIKVVGTLAQIHPGAQLRIEGRIEHDGRFGEQLRAAAIQIDIPRNRDAIVRYLSSGILPGVGRGLAEKLVASTWPDTIDVLDHYPGRIERIRGIGENRGRRIFAAWKLHRSVETLADRLCRHGVSRAIAERIYRRYREKALEVVQQNPYRLVEDIRGVGFQVADTIARQFGTPPTSPFRLASGLKHVLQDAARRHGHVFLPRAVLLKQAASLLAVPEPLLGESLDELLAREELVRDTVGPDSAVYLPTLLRAETGVAAEVGRLAASARGVPRFALDAALAWARSRNGLELSGSQSAAARLVLDAKVSVLTGGPGTGKTTLVKSILDIVRAKGARVRLCAPTGRAAKRLSQATGMPATTVHRLLQYDPSLGGFGHDARSPLEGDVFLMDEWSMGDLALTHALLRAIPGPAMVVFVGDVDQLPSISPGTVLADLIRGGVATARLSNSEVFRQARDSGILTAADAINRGALPPIEGTTLDQDFVFIEADGAEAIRDEVVRLVVEALPVRGGFDPLTDIQVLTPFNRGPLGTEALNEVLQRVLLAGAQPEVLRAGRRFRIGDKLIQCDNNYQKEVFNGDVGFLVGFDEDEGELTVRFEGEQDVVYRFDELDELRHANAITVHRSQGSEYPVVVMPVTTAHHVLLTRSLLYTAVTRGKQKVVLVGERRALAQAIRHHGSSRRYGALDGRLKHILSR